MSLQNLYIEQKTNDNKCKTVTDMVYINPNISTITLKVSDLDTLLKRQIIGV